MKRIAMLMISLMLGLSGLINANELDGKWRTTFMVRQIERQAVLNLMVDGEKLTGTISSPRANGEISNGTVKGTKGSFEAETVGITLKYEVKLDKNMLVVTNKEFNIEWKMAKVENETIDGNWAGEMTMGNGRTFQMSYVFQTNGEELTGSAESQWGSTPISNGKISGTKLSFDVQNGNRSRSYEGKIDGDELILKSGEGDNVREMILKKKK